MKLETCDIILWINEKNDPISRLSRWAIGPYSHVAMYLEKFEGVPMVYESRGRGVTIASLLPQIGSLVAVMRPIFHLLPLKPPFSSPETFIPLKTRIIKTALLLAADEKSFYDYSSIVHSVLPRIIAEKLPWLPLPVKYHRDIFFICSEAVAEVWWRNDMEILPRDVIPLPMDFALSPILRYVGTGKLMEDIVPHDS